MNEFSVNAALTEQRCQRMRSAQILHRDARRVASYLLTGLFFSALSAQAEAPLSQEFWNYLVEYGDTQGEVFDPSDFAAAANISDKARSEFNRTQTPSSSEPAHLSSEPVSVHNSSFQSLKDGQEQPQ